MTTELNAAARLLAESYPGNIGMMEMMKFYKVATPAQKQQMQSFMNEKKFDKGWQLLQDVTGVKLHATAKSQIIDFEGKRYLVKNGHDVYVYSRSSRGEGHFRRLVNQLGPLAQAVRKQQRKGE
jgi:hypothetical protein